MPLTYPARRAAAAMKGEQVGIPNGWTATEPGPNSPSYQASARAPSSRHSHFSALRTTSGCAKSTSAVMESLRISGPSESVRLRAVREQAAARTDRPLRGRRHAGCRAAAHANGRRLFIVTTNLDSQRVAIWDMGRIASSGSPEALSLFRDVLAASASVPSILLVLIEAAADGKRFGKCTSTEA